MNYIPYLIIVLGAISLLIFLILRDRRGSVEALIFKTITSFFFLCTAFTAFVVNQASANMLFYMLISMGLICGLIGDIVLDLKIIYKESSSLYQFAGMTSFLIGHVFYLTALFIYFGFNWLPLVLALIISVVVILMSSLVLKFKFKEHTVHIYLYSFALTYFMTQTIYSAISAPSATTILLAIGGIAFLLSDLILVMTYYDNKDSKLFIASNHILYYLAQFTIALSVLYLVA